MSKDKKAMNNQVAFKQPLAVKYNVDVAVMGGGPSGLAAAVIAARQGCRVLLVEAQNCLGGMGTSGLLPILMPFGDGVNYYAGGFGREVHDKLLPAGATIPGHPYGKLLSPIRVEGLKRLYDDLTLTAGVSLLLETRLVAVECDQGVVNYVVCAAKSGLFAVRAKVYVDATGDGDLCAWAGAPFEKGDANGEMMGGTLCSLWMDIDWPTVRKSKADAEEVLIQALREDHSILPQCDPHLPGIVEVGPAIGGGNVGHCYGVDGTDEKSLTEAAIFSRRLLPAYERFYRARMKGYERASLLATAPLLGIRETRRIFGDYVLNEADFYRKSVFVDEIGRYHYFIDTHLSKPDWDNFEKHLDLRKKTLSTGGNYGIPYRCLTPRGLANVLVGGRCISTDRAMQSSVRVTPGCFITGQACGMAASMMAASGKDSRSISVAELQQRLLKIGAFLPNAKGVAAPQEKTADKNQKS